MAPTVGRIVHYVSPGSADGTYPPAHRAAIVTEVPTQIVLHVTPETPQLNLCVLNPTGVHFVKYVSHDGSPDPEGYTWHWPEHEEEKSCST